MLKECNSPSFDALTCHLAVVCVRYTDVPGGWLLGIISVMIVRLPGGLVVYFVINSLLKLSFSKEFLSSGTSAALMVRCARYAVVSFVDFGVYPMLFRLENHTAK